MKTIKEKLETLIALRRHAIRYLLDPNKEVEESGLPHQWHLLMIIEFLESCYIILEAKEKAALREQDGNVAKSNKNISTAIIAEKGAKCKC